MRMRYLLFGAALLAGACASAASNGVTCGPGTVLEDDQCVPAPTGDAGEGPVAEAGGPPPKAGSSDGGPDEVDAGPPIHIGDPCDPLQQNGACYGKLAFTCSPGVTLDAGVFEQLDDCSLMGGDCIPAQAGFAGAHCVGGGYTSCNPLTDWALPQRRRAREVSVDEPLQIDQLRAHGAHLCRDRCGRLVSMNGDRGDRYAQAFTRASKNARSMSFRASAAAASKCVRATSRFSARKCSSPSAAS